MESFATIINRWPTAAQFGREVGISDVLARQWRNRNSIPAHAWIKVEQAAAERGYEGVTVELMALIARQKTHCCGQDSSHQTTGNGERAA